MARESKGITLPIVYKANLDGIKQAEGALSGFGKKLAGVAAGIAAAFSIRAITNFAKEAVAVAEQAATAQARLEAVAKATNVFGAETQKVTDRLAEFAKQQELRIAVDDKVIKGVQAQLLSFKQLSATADTAGGTFDRVTQAAFDMAAAGFGSAESNAIALGKAFEDPIRGLTALRRSGTVFTQEQQDLIKSLVETGNVAAAQEIILGELETQYGGVAEATANASDKLAIAFENIKETAGAALLPVFAELVTGMMPVLELIGDEIAKAFTDLGPVLQNLVGQVPGLVKAFVPLIPALGKIAEIFLELVAKLLPPFAAFLNQLMPLIEELVPLFGDVFLQVLEALAPVFMEIVMALMPIVQTLLPVLAKLIGALAPIIVRLIQSFMPIINLLLPIFIDLLNLLTPILLFAAKVFEFILPYAINLFIGIIKYSLTVIEGFAKIFAAIWQGIKIVFISLINELIGNFEGFINGFIDGFNAIVRGINVVRRALKMDPLELAARVQFARLEVPKLTPLATGGLVMRPTAALVGEAGAEAVIPLDRLDRMGGNTYNITVNAGLGTNGTQVGAEIVSLIKRYERSSGPVFASA